MCRGPFAYGQATATRIFLGFGLVVTGVNDRERPLHDPGCDQPCAGEKQRNQQAGEEAEGHPSRSVRFAILRRGCRGRCLEAFRPPLRSNAGQRGPERSRGARSRRCEVRAGGARGKPVTPRARSPPVVRVTTAMRPGRRPRGTHTCGAGVWDPPGPQRAALRADDELLCSRRAWFGGIRRRLRSRGLRRRVGRLLCRDHGLNGHGRRDHGRRGRRLGRGRRRARRRRSSSRRG
jgi:hypothetical protein